VYTKTPRDNFLHVTTHNKCQYLQFLNAALEAIYLLLPLGMHSTRAHLLHCHLGHMLFEQHHFCLGRHELLAMLPTILRAHTLKTCISTRMHDIPKICAVRVCVYA